MHISSVIKYFSLVCFIHIIGCAAFDLSQYGSSAYIIKGRIHFLEVEGGCWVLISEKGERYELSGEVIVSHFKDGIYAELAVHNLEEIATVCMVGKVVEVLEIIQLSQL